MKAKEEKRSEAKYRQSLRNQLSPLQQLDKLDRQFGNGRGAMKERQRLLVMASAALRKA